MPPTAKTRRDIAISDGRGGHWIVALATAVMWVVAGLCVVGAAMFVAWWRAHG